MVAHGKHLWRVHRHCDAKDVWCDGRQAATVNRARHACVLKYSDPARGLESTPRGAKGGPPGASTATATSHIELWRDRRHRDGNDVWCDGRHAATVRIARAIHVF
jgi:hypothetical protein